MRAAQRNLSVLLPGILGAAVGAGLITFLGAGSRRRRALVRDKTSHALHQAAHAADIVARDAAHRVKGRATELSHRIGERRLDVPNEILSARARARLGHVCSHPHAVQIEARSGELIVSGVIVRREHAAVIRALCSVRGAHKVTDRLLTYDEPTSQPALQESERRARAVPALLHDNWAPALRFVAAAAGVGLLSVAFWSRRLVAISAGIIGASLVGRASTNMPFAELFGVRRARRTATGHGVRVHKTMTIRAPIDDVFNALAMLEEFPRFLRHVKRVDVIDEVRSHWTVEGPLKIAASWDAVTTRLEPNKIIAWKSVAGSMIENSGSIEFVKVDDTSTRITIKLAYLPPAGALGHAFAKLLGHDPKRLLDEDLLRMKTLLEEQEPAVPTGEAVP